MLEIELSSPSTARVKAITDMMYEFGMYTQAGEIDRLAAERDQLKQRVAELERHLAALAEKNMVHQAQQSRAARQILNLQVERDNREAAATIEGLRRALKIAEGVECDIDYLTHLIDAEIAALEKGVG